MPRTVMFDQAWRGLLAPLLVIGCTCFVFGQPLVADDVEVGKPAPDFEMIGSDGKTYKLSDFKDKQAVIVAWYPKAFTGG